MSMVANKDRPTKWWGRSDAQGKTPTDLMNEDDINERLNEKGIDAVIGSLILRERRY
jgi:hypothetical protein